MIDLTGRIAFITGGAQGIGLEVATRLAKQGANVALGDINEEKAKQSAEEITALGFGKAIGVYCNVTSIESLAESMKKTADEFGGIDILVNNAGVLHATPISDITMDEWNRQISINLTGAFFAMQQVFPYLKESKAGRIINLASVAGRMGSYASGMGYVASKGGLISLTYGVARQFTKHGITVNCLAPGPIATDMVNEWTQEAKDDLVSRIPVGRFGTTHDIAALISFLASDDAGYISGACLDINGGMHIG